MSAWSDSFKMYMRNIVLAVNCIIFWNTLPRKRAEADTRNCTKKRSCIEKRWCIQYAGFRLQKTNKKEMMLPRQLGVVLFYRRGNKTSKLTGVPGFRSSLTTHAYSLWLQQTGEGITVLFGKMGNIGWI